MQPILNASKAQKLRRGVRCYLNGDLTTVAANSAAEGRQHVGGFVKQQAFKMAVRLN